MGDRYYDAHDADMRLVRSVVRYKGHAAYVKRIYPDNVRADITYLKSDCEACVNYTSPEFDYLNIPSGYVNYNSTNCWYITRGGQRRQKQGLHEGNLVGIVRGNSAMIPGHVLQSKQLSDMFDNDYPSFSEAMAKITDEKLPWLACAFDCDLCIRRKFRQITLEYKGYTIGIQQGPGGPFGLTLNASSVAMNCIRGILERSGVHVA